MIFSQDFLCCTLAENKSHILISVLCLHPYKLTNAVSNQICSHDYLFQVLCIPTPLLSLLILAAFRIHQKNYVHHACVNQKNLLIVFAPYTLYYNKRVELFQPLKLLFINPSHHRLFLHHPNRHPLLHHLPLKCQYSILLTF